MDPKQRYREVRRVTLIGSLVDLVLGVVKLFFGWWAQSQALVADGIHSLSDLLTDVVVLLASREAHREADDEHPYGHARIETIATVALGISLVLVGAGVAVDATRRLFAPHLLWHPGPTALVVAVASVVGKEAIYQYTARAARRLRSDLLMANAWHSRTDAVSSVFVIVGVAGSLAGLGYVDAVAAVAVAVLIAKIGIQLAWQSGRELIDTGLESSRLEAIREAIMSVDGVEALHMLRTRRMAGRAFVDVHILLENPRLSVSEGHQISETVRARLIDRIDEVADVTVHIDPEDDELLTPNRSLPLRRNAMRRIEAAWKDLPETEHSHDVRLHYLDGKLHVEVVMPLDAAGGNPELLRRRIAVALAQDPDIGGVRVLFE